MIYVLHGTDIAKSREKVRTLLQTLLSKKPDAFVVRLNEEEYSQAVLDDYIESQGLFEEKSIIVLDTLFNNLDAKSFILASLKRLQASQNVFILLEEKVDAKTITKLEKHAEKVQECSLPKKAQEKNAFNIFALADAIQAKDRKQLWVVFQEGRIRNISAEEMHGIMFWSVKNMLLAEKSGSAKEAGLSPFVFKKAQSGSKSYRNGELQHLSHNLVEMYHQARRGVISFELGLERLILEI